MNERKPKTSQTSIPKITTDDEKANVMSQTNTGLPAANSTLGLPKKSTSVSIKSEADDQKAAAEGDLSKPEYAPTEVLCEQAERFRMRLIRHFRLLENLNEMEIILETPKYHPIDILDDATRRELLENNPYALVKLNTVSKRYRILTKQARRWKRIQCRETSYPPLDLWANWVVESNWFQHCVLLVILVDAILLIVDGEIGIQELNDSYTLTVVQTIRTFDYCCLWIFLLEIFFKWIDDFKLFWKNGWNQLDFCVTVVSVLPDILQWFTTNSQVNTGSTLFSTLGFLRVLRITRLLKIVSRFEQARIILLSVSKAFSAMSFILLLLALLMWIFALAGQVLFVRYTRFDGRPTGLQLSYQSAFSDILWSFATLFQLMTLDHWLATLTDILKVMIGSYESITTVVFILAWIWVGSFVFKNIFAGIMVNNFQTIRNDLHWEKKEREAKLEVDKFKKEIAEGVVNAESIEKVKGGIPTLSSLDFQADDIRTDDETAYVEEGKNLSAQAFKVPSALSLMSRYSTVTPIEKLPKDKYKKAKWENIVQRHIELSDKIPGEFLWSRDLLFRYFQTMEMMQENLKERSQILQYLNLAILQMHDH